MGDERKINNPNESIMDEMDYKTFVNVISEIPSCIFIKDTDLKYRFSSHVWNQLNSDNVVGKTDYEIRKDKENSLIAMESDREIIRSGKGKKYVIESDIDGEVSYLELNKEPIFDGEGNVIGIVGLINDVTEKTIMDRELKASLEKVEQMNALQKMFTASINHELRSPLNGIMGILQILRDDRSLGIEQRDYVDSAYQSAGVMLEIVNDLLDHAKMETGEFKVHYDKFDLRDIVHNIEQIASKMAGAKGLEFSINVSDLTYCKLICDEIRIYQVLNNLVSNAIKYTEKGQVTLGISYEDGCLIFRCADTGQGISDESQKVLFDPYVRLNEQKNKHINGTGLGLSIVKKIIDAMNGTITVDSAVGRGSVFTVRIPMGVYDTSVNFGTERVQYEDKKLTADFSNLKVLCVDDTSVNVTVFCGLLKDTGILIDRAYSGAECIEMAAVQKYDVIFMDHQMPEMDGVETFEHIRGSKGINCNTPVVIMTANAGSDYEQQYIAQGFNAYLPKPVIKNNLINVIKKIQ